MYLYRADIDGLRAIAVLSVVFYHAGLGFAGGYVGVDVFFVISGYLITALILKDLERGSFSMANFWERRIRRIFPALAVMVAVTCVAGWFLLLPEDLAKLGASVIAQSLLVSNFYFWRTTNYFGGANEEKPLLHTWSLAVEEQFYLIFPIALMSFWWAWSRWQKAQADRILGTTNHTNLHEKGEGCGAWSKELGADGKAECGNANKLKNEGSTDYTTERQGGREEEQPKVGPKGEGVGSGGGNQLADSMEFLDGQSQAGLQMDSQIPNSIRAAKDSGTSGSHSSSVSISAIRGSNSESLDSGRVRQWNVQPVESEKITPPAKHIHTGSSLDSAPSPAGDQRRWVLFWLFAAGALLSLGISVWGVKAQPFATFFLLPTRAWELLLGSMLAVLPATVVVRNAALREILCLAGLAGIFLPVFFYDEKTPFPGLAALPPCLGTAALIWANSHSSCDSQHAWTARALSWSPIVFIGLISYSLYLWHWPIICFFSYWAVQEFNLGEKSLIIFASFIFAIASWKFVESPFRYKKQKFQSSILFKTAFFTTMVFCIVGLGVIHKKGMPDRFSEEVKIYLSELQYEKNVVIDFEKNKYNRFAGVEGLLADNPIRLGCSKNSPSFILFGDSHARYLAPLFDEIGSMEGVSGNLISHTATPPLMGWEHEFPGLTYNNSDKLFNDAIKYAKEKNIKVVFLAAYWSTYQFYGGSLELEQALMQTLNHINGKGLKAYILMDHPTYEYDVPKGEIRTRIASFLRVQEQTLKQHYAKNSVVYNVLDALQNVESLDPTNKFLKSDKNSLKTSLGEKPLYLDNNHLTHTGVRYAWEDQIQLIFKKFPLERE